MMEIHGVRPTEYLHAHDFLGPRLVAAHCRYLDPAEVALMGSTRSSVSHQPAMAARRAVLPPIAALRDAGCVVGLGTDNNTQDMVEVMRAALFTERILRHDPERPQPEDVLEEATLGSARVLHVDGLIGTLEAGKKADPVRGQHAARAPRADHAHRLGLRPQRPAGRHRGRDGGRGRSSCATGASSPSTRRP